MAAESLGQAGRGPDRAQHWVGDIEVEVKPPGGSPNNPRSAR
jgi:hypothetical protein